MIAHRGINQQRLRMTRRNHRVEFGIKKAAVKMILLGIAVRELRVRIDDAHQLDIVLFGKLLEKARHVAVLQADNRHADGGLLGKCAARMKDERYRKQMKQDANAIPHDFLRNLSLYVIFAGAPYPRAVLLFQVNPLRL